MQKSDLPFGSEFSPTQIDLPVVLDLVKQHEGNQADFEEAIKAKFFAKNRTSDYNKRKLAMNLRLTRHAYLIKSDGLFLSVSSIGVNMSWRSPDIMKLQGFHIIRNKTSLLMRNPCSFKGEEI